MSDLTSKDRVCLVCECPDDDHYDWCTTQARKAAELPPSKENDIPQVQLTPEQTERSHQLKAAWERPNTQWLVPISLTRYIVHLQDELKRHAHEPGALPEFGYDKQFTVHRGDVGSSVYRDEYVLWLESQLKQQREAPCPSPCYADPAEGVPHRSDCPKAVVVTVDAVNGDKAAISDEVTLHLDGATPEFVRLRVGDQVGIPVRTAPPPGLDEAERVLMFVYNDKGTAPSQEAFRRMFDYFQRSAPTKEVRHD